MLTSSAKTTGGFEYAGEYYTACCAFLSGTDPSMPSKALIHRFARDLLIYGLLVCYPPNEVVELGILVVRD